MNRTRSRPVLAGSRLNRHGRLVVRVALAPDALQNLARQINALRRPPQQQGDAAAG